MKKISLRGELVIQSESMQRFQEIREIFALFKEIKIKIDCIQLQIDDQNEVEEIKGAVTKALGLRLNNN